MCLACFKIKLYVKVIYNLQKVYKHYMINRTNFRVDKEIAGHLLFSFFLFFFFLNWKQDFAMKEVICSGK